MCKCESDVAGTMKWIQPYLLSGLTTFRIRSGGHSQGGYSLSLNAIIIDLSLMKNINITELLTDDVNNLLSIEAGVLLGDYENWGSIMKYEFNHEAKLPPLFEMNALI